MISPRPFQAHQFALLHLLGIVSISRSQEQQKADEGLQLPEDAAAFLILPQKVILNAYCYLTEQIHEVAKPPDSLQDMVNDVYSLAPYLVPPPPLQSTTLNGSPTTTKSSTRRGSTRSPSKRASTSPASTRTLRRSTSRAALNASTAPSETSSATPPPQVQVYASTPIIEDQAPEPSLFKIDGQEPDRSRATYALAERLHRNVLADITQMKEDRSDVLFASLGEFKVLLGDLNNPNSVAFLDRTSPLGMWLRRALLNLNTLKFTQSEQLIDDMLAWAGMTEPATSRDLEDEIFFSCTKPDQSGPNSLRTRTELVEQYQEAIRKEDYSQSLELMQRFFDYETFPLAGGSSSNRGMRQHALLNLAQFHYTHAEFPAARIAANEGMKVARHAADLIALNALTSLIKKINFEDSADRARYKDGGHADVTLDDISKEDQGGYVPPLDYLWDIRFGISARVPLPALFFDVIRAKALTYFAANQKLNLSSKERRKEKKLAAQQGKDALVAGADAQQRRLRWNRLDTIGLLATCADLWDSMGAEDLAHTYRILGITAKRGDIDPYSGAKITLQCKQALQLAQQGHFDAALATCLAIVAHPDRMKLTTRDVQIWQRAVYNVLRIQAGRSENDLLVQEIDQVTPPAPVGTAFPTRAAAAPDPLSLGFPTIEPEPTTESGLIGEITSCIQRAEKFLSISQSAAALPLAVRAYSLASLGDGMALLGLYRRSALLLVRVQVEFKTCDRALRILNEVWADILGSSDDELIAYAKEVRANTLIALVDQVVEERGTAEEEGDEALCEASELLSEAAELRWRLGSTAKYLENLIKLAKLYHEMDDTETRDEVAQTCRSATNEWLDSKKRKTHQDQNKRFELVQRICVYASTVVAA